MKRRAWILSLLVVACSSTPHEAPPVEARPAWLSGPTRAVEGDQIYFVGVGEDRIPGNARPKAQAMALQDLANECSFVPRGTQIESQTFDEEVGIIHRSYVRASVSADACGKARDALTSPQLRALADPALQAQIQRYQANYDPPEPTERPGADTDGLDAFAQYYALRQQVALAKQSIVLSSTSPSQDIPDLSEDVGSFAKEHVEVLTVPRAFSERRPNVSAHLPSAVRDTIAERKRIEDAYPATPHPRTRPSSPRGGQGRGGRRRRGMPAPAPESTPTPSPSPGF